MLLVLSSRDVRLAPVPEDVRQRRVRRHGRPVVVARNEAVSLSLTMNTVISRSLSMSTKKAFRRLPDSLVGGYMVVAAENHDRALEVARECPGVVRPGSSVEIREIASP